MRKNALVYFIPDLVMVIVISVRSCQRKEVKTARWFEVEHPLINYHVVIQCGDYECVFSFRNFVHGVSDSLTAHHVFFPTFGAVFFPERTDLRFSVAGRKWVAADGRINMPDGEIFTSPDTDTINGHIEFDLKAA